MIRRLDVKFVLLLVATALLPMIASVYLVLGAVETALGVGLNRDIANSLDRSVAAFRNNVESIKVAQRVFMTSLKNHRHLHGACQEGDRAKVERVLRSLLDRRMHVVRLSLTMDDGQEVTVADPSMQDMDGLRPVVRTSSVRAGSCESVQAMFGVDVEILTSFHQAASHAEAYTTLFRAPRSYLVTRVILIYGLLMLVVGGLVVWQGVFLTRRLARRIHTLSHATQQVAQGDLSVRVEPGAADEVGELIGSFNAMVEEIGSTRARIEYLQKISTWQEIARRLAHEIKNPLTPIHLAVQQMRNKYRQDDPAFERLLHQSVDIIEEEVNTLQRLVSDFSAFARLPRISPERTDLGTFLAECQGSLEYMQEQHGIDLSFELPAEPIHVALDAMMMKRVVDNLVRNAAEALQHADVTKPAVSVFTRRHKEKDHSFVTIHIEDNGPGIQPEHHRSLFEPYYTTKEEGTGLGLAICKKIVLDHNGTIKVDEDPDRTRGASFVVRLPVVP